MNASPEMMNLIKQKQDELNRMQNEYNSVIQRGNYQNESKIDNYYLRVFVQGDSIKTNFCCTVLQGFLITAS